LLADCVTTLRCIDQLLGSDLEIITTVQHDLYEVSGVPEEVFTLLAELERDLLFSASVVVTG
jgi:hypothetical protein